MEEIVSNFIVEHGSKSPSEVALILSKRKDLPKEFILNQINGCQKAKNKFPFLSNFANFIYPSSRAISQSSSEKTAAFKASIIAADYIADLSGGMGLDSYFFSKKAKQSYYIESDTELAELTAKNFKILGRNNIEVNAKKASNFLEETNKRFDLIYIDPDRRVAKEKAFRIDECEPNVSELLNSIWEKSSLCMIKLSPMLDISQALQELPHCKEVYVVSVDNDCKELLFLLDHNFNEEPYITCINIKKLETQHFIFSKSKEKKSVSTLSIPQNYLYESNSSILKAGAFKCISEEFKVNKLATNTHLYTSTDFIENFPGRQLKILKVEKAPKDIKNANVVCRNFYLSPEQLKKKYKIKDGGNHFLYATTLENKERVFILCELA